MKKVLFAVVIASVMFSLPAYAAQKVLADFNSGTKPNNVGGDFGAWDKDPVDNTQTCVEAFDDVVKHGEKGFSMKLKYDVDSPSPAFNGFWMKLNGINLAPYKTLNFWIKGDSAAGYTSRFKVELKTPDGVGAYYVTGINDKWQLFSIPLEAFNLPSLENCQEFVIVFEDRIADTKSGIIYIDDISVE